ncbi:eukaryotic aspartyl protease [Ancylostoma caninum]|uniref:Eukaryotic aspartyl protease n=1 Tax=Ancylostoma caninum TaxID=29170 RepID=A0A368H8D1_ANCCA|nr:eukaryotic aspartyl protease [Ancylostoma caninum]
MLLVLALLAEASYAVPKTYQLPLIKIQSEMMRMLRAGTWTAHVEEMRAKHNKLLGAPGERSEFIHDINGYHDMEYVANITIGNPEQNFTVVLDTGTADTWVIDYTCSANKPTICEDSICDEGLICEVFCTDQSCCEKKRPMGRNPCQGKRYFQSAKSSSYVPMDGRWWMTYRPYGAAAYGFYGNDTLRFGGSGTEQLVVPATKIGFADTIDKRFASRPVDGIVGMAFPFLSFNDVVSPFERAWKLGLVEPVFTVYMERVGWRAENVFGGSVTYGGLDTVHCGDLISYQPLKGANFWVFEVTNVTAGGFVCDYKTTAISDTGSSFFGAPAYYVEEIASNLTATYNKEHDLYYIDCRANASITLTIGGRLYKIESKNLIIHVDADTCILALYGYHFLGATWIFGAPFIRQFCNIYDMGKKQIGFAHSLQN